MIAQGAVGGAEQLVHVQHGGWAGVRLLVRGRRYVLLHLWLLGLRRLIVLGNEGYVE